MDPVQYYSKTLTNAASNLGPWIIFAIIGYVFFMKLPFSVLLKGLQASRPKEAEEDKGPVIDAKKVDDKFRLDEKTYQERLEEARKEKEKQQKRWEEQKKQQQESRQEKKQEKKQGKKKDGPKKAPAQPTAAEELFEINAGESLSKSELKKRYHELLKQNHPDKVAALGADFKKLAEKKTKDINSAYDELKKKAS